MINNREISAIITLIKDLDYEMLDDKEWRDLQSIDPSNDEQLLKIFNQICVSTYDDLDMHSKDLIKSSLSKVLSSSDFDYQIILGQLNMPFEPIENPKYFFALLWLALFKKEF
ncbi:hypothetical protein F975_01794 [Acinetobacter sp. ANC 3789]|uniref:hypothetical protein n=1 Tax=Acinetobacter sp. ANC 3789 TaxID=1217714 RepID=UPI0002CED571|nr:hypothetical protein [Acinetobacter sp. ANC 3789]ENU80042.1 hypothetical protein F975_01794 [Acinetobacter sp. ANC 3789]